MQDILFEAHLQSCLAVVETALDGMQLDAVVIQAGDTRYAFQDDQTYPFRVNPWFAWLVPSPPAPGSLLQIRTGHAPRLAFVAPDDYWHSPPEIPSDPWSNHFQIVVVPDAMAAVAALQQFDGAMAWIGESTPPDPAWSANPTTLLAILEQTRCHKTAYEIDCLRHATHLGVQGHLAAERAFRNGASEFDIHLAFLSATRQNETALPYGSIVALNEHCATLHYQLRDLQPPARRFSLLIDAGASWRGYASDITRTWATSPGIFADLIDGMHRLQLELCEAVAPGTSWPALHLRAHHLVAQLLHHAGLLRMSAEDAVSSGVSAAFLPHGLGHLLGLQVHDVGGFRPSADADPIARPAGHKSLRLTRQLEPGMVVTVEPGLYFIDSLLHGLRTGPHASAVNWTLVETLHPCGGIRIEDNVLVTRVGHDNLTRTAFADVN